MITLYRKNANSIGTWRIWNDNATIHIAHATVIGGSEVHHEEYVKTGLAGRSLEEQINLRIRSRVSRMRDKGYKDSIEEAQNSSTNQLGLVRPMLAKSFNKVSNVNVKGAVIQRKLDGHRCLVTKYNGELIAYSRQGKIINSISHILDGLKDFVPEGVTLDGELYIHRVPLQTIASLIKRKQPDSLKLCYVVYDLISDESYKDRFEELQGMLRDVPLSRNSLLLLPYVEYSSHENLSSEFKRVRSLGFEGLMVRLDGYGYEDGKRSTSLLKVKEFEEHEFLCIDIEPSSDGWGVCVLKTSENKVFRASAPGTIVEKQEQLNSKEKYIGRMLTVQYSTLTNDNIPFHASGLRWREDI